MGLVDHDRQRRMVTEQVQQQQQQQQQMNAPNKALFIVWTHSTALHLKCLEKSFYLKTQLKNLFKEREQELGKACDSPPVAQTHMYPLQELASKSQAIKVQMIPLQATHMCIIYYVIHFLHTTMQ